MGYQVVRKPVSENVSHLENPLFEEADYNGRLFYLSLPDSTSLNCSWLKEKLDGRRISFECDLGPEDRDNLHVPEVFESAVEEGGQIGSLQNLTEIHNEALNGVMGYISHNESDTVKYDDKEILIFDQQLTKFLIFEAQDEIFLLILSSRDSMTLLYNMLSEELEEIGFVVEEITISHTEFDEIANVLIDTHRMTAVEGYEEDSIHKKLIIGHNYGDTQEYKQEKDKGTVHGLRFGTSQLDGSSKTIQISYDCLIRSYHKISLSMYLLMVTSFIIPSLSLSKQTPLSWYGSESAEVQTDPVTDD